MLLNSWPQYDQEQIDASCKVLAVPPLEIIWKPNSTHKALANGMIFSLFETLNNASGGIRQKINAFQELTYAYAS